MADKTALEILEADVVDTMIRMYRNLEEGDHQAAHSDQEDLHKIFTKFLATNAPGKLGDIAKTAMQTEEWGIKPW